MKKKILLIGSSGFIGTAIKQLLLTNGHKVICCDIDDSTTVKDYFAFKDYTNFLLNISKHQFDFVINAGGNGNVQNSILNPKFDFESNVVLVHSILEAIRQTQIGCRLVHFSSAAVYGEPETSPILETDLLKPISPYGFNKMTSELICKQYSNLYNINCIILRPFSVYGPGLKKQLFWDVLCKFKNSTHNAPIEFFGTGSETRDFIFIDDLCQIINLILKNPHHLNNFELINAANGIEIEINTVIQIISGYFPGIPYTFSGKKRPGDPDKWRADISKLNLLGYTPKVSMEEGLAFYYNWFNGLTS